MWCEPDILCTWQLHVVMCTRMCRFHVARIGVVNVHK